MATPSLVITAAAYLLGKLRKERALAATSAPPQSAPPVGSATPANAQPTSMPNIGPELQRAQDFPATGAARDITQLLAPVRAPTSIAEMQANSSYTDPAGLVAYLSKNPCSWSGVFSGANTAWWVITTTQLSTSDASAAGYLVRTAGQSQAGPLVVILYGPPSLPPPPPSYGQLIGSGQYNAGGCQQGI